LNLESIESTYFIQLSHSSLSAMLYWLLQGFYLCNPWKLGSVGFHAAAQRGGGCFIGVTIKGLLEH